MFGLAFRALLLDGSVFQEIKDREETMFAALGIVVISGLAFGLGIWVALREPGVVGFDQREVLGLIMSTSTILSGWFLWTLFVWILGIRLFQGDTGFRGSLTTVRRRSRYESCRDTPGPGTMLNLTARSWESFTRAVMT